MVWIATTGQGSDCPKTGMVTVVVRHLSCKVFDHFMSTKALDSPKLTSALHRCLEASNVAIECGKILDSLKKEKKLKECRPETLEGDLNDGKLTRFFLEVEHLMLKQYVVGKAY